MLRLSRIGAYYQAIVLACCCLDTLAVLCQPSQDVCEFWLVVEEALTMQHLQYGLLVPHQGHVYAYNDTNRDTPIQGGFVQADGFWNGTRMVMTVNGSIPGPAIEVYENQTVLVHVKNALESESLTIHWHGVHQIETAFMDGVPMISQCPILPGQVFDYRFLAWPEGTHWYHSHSGVQRTNGVHGSFVVHPQRARKQIRPAEHIMVLSEWTHDYDSTAGHLKARYGLYSGKTKYTSTQSVDGSRFGPQQFQSGLINGKGRYWSSAAVHNEAPLEIFTVTPPAVYRFRVIGAGGLYPFRVSVDAHTLLVVAADGFRVVPTPVDSFVIYPGERVDFLINTTAAVGNYWVRAETLEQNVRVPHVAEAVLHYAGAPPPRGDYDGAVTSRPRACTADRPCVVLNCPFSFFPATAHARCVLFSSLQSSDEENSVAPEGVYSELFLNFAFAGPRLNRGSVNRRSFKSPSALAYASRSGFTNCSDTGCAPGEELCKCTHTIEMTHGHIYQLVFLNMGLGKGAAHPVHMHGHTFHVVKIGYGLYNESTGLAVADTRDIECHDALCSRASWRNRTWSERGLPDLSLSTAIQKDTIVVPSGGYIVVRVRALNPGLWFMHCHIDVHHLDGMALLIDAGASLRPALPLHFPQCHDFKADAKPIRSRAATSGESRSRPLWTAMLTGLAATSRNYF